MPFATPPPTSLTPWQKLRSRKRFWLVVGWLGLVCITALFASVLANDKPLKTTYRGTTYYPVLQPAQLDSFSSGNRLRWQRFDQVDWKSQELEDATWPPIPFGTRLLSATKNLPPTSEGALGRHWLGTTPNGIDLFASMIHGSRISLFVGLLAASIAILLGVLIGALAGYWGDDRLSLSKGGLIGLLVGLIPTIFYAWFRRSIQLELAAKEGLGSYLLQFVASLLIGWGLLSLFFWLGKRLFLRLKWEKKWRFPLDTLLFRLSEWMSTLPRLLFVLSITAMFRQPSIWILMAIIGVVSWPGIAIQVRGQILSIQQRSYIDAARALGIPDKRIVWRHVLPNALPPILIVFSSSIGGAIALESALSFLGLAEANLSWGSLLSMARNHFDSWWLVLVPGGAIFLTVLSFHVLAELIRDAWDPAMHASNRLSA
ncbi:MAG: ABC transporter permease [Bacteroidota bacterium]